MSISRALRWALPALLCTGALVAGASPPPTTAATGTTRLRVTFDEVPAGTTLTAGATIADTSGHANNGVVVTATGGTIAARADTVGVVADFPNNCASPPCASALVQIDDDPWLDPEMGNFEFGARILMQANETADGENVVQKGVTDEPGGQWKLQVDKAGGRPSCVVSGMLPGETQDRRVLLKASVDVADGVWHQVTCRRTAAGVDIVIDGVVNASAAMPMVNVSSNAPVTIGANRVTPSPNDQFHGIVDDVFMIAEAAPVFPPTTTIASATAAASAAQPADRLPIVESP